MYYSLLCLLMAVSPLFSQEKSLEHILHALPSGSIHEVVIDKVGGGQTNQNYRATLNGKSYFIKSSSGGAELLGASLEREWICTSLVSAGGIAPRIISYFPEHGVMVSEFLEGQKFDVRLPDMMEKYCKAIRSLHQLDIKFPNTFCPFKAIWQLMESAKEVNAEYPEKLVAEILPKVRALEVTMTSSFHPVPCHLDLHVGNLIHQGDRMWLIDWEYAAMGDPLFDLATLASADHLNQEEMNLLLKTYLERAPSDHEEAYFAKMRFLADVRWAIWSYIQAAISELDEPFKDYADLFLSASYVAEHELNGVYQHAT